MAHSSFQIRPSLTHSNFCMSDTDSASSKYGVLSDRAADPEKLSLCARIGNSAKVLGKGYWNILTKGFEGNQNARPLKLHRFNPFTKFVEVVSDKDAEIFRYFLVDKASFAGQPPEELIKDGTTKWLHPEVDAYLNDRCALKRVKHAGLVVGTAPVHAIGLALVTLNSLVKIIISLIHPPASYTILEFGKDVLRLFSLLLLPLLFITAIYGLFDPHSAGKVYAAFESLAYGQALLAPCFQPNPEYHLFGGDIKKDNEF